MTVVTKLLTTGLDELIDQLKPRAKKILKDSAFHVEAKAKINAPADTTALRNSITTVEVSDYLFRVQDGVEYGIYQELGTSKMAAQPFLTPAVEAERAAFEAAWAELFL